MKSKIIQIKKIFKFLKPFFPPTILFLVAFLAPANTHAKESIEDKLLVIDFEISTEIISDNNKLNPIQNFQRDLLYYLSNDPRIGNIYVSDQKNLNAFDLDKSVASMNFRYYLTGSFNYQKNKEEELYEFVSYLRDTKSGSITKREGKRITFSQKDIDDVVPLELKAKKLAYDLVLQLTKTSGGSNQNNSGKQPLRIWPFCFKGLNNPVKNKLVSQKMPHILKTKLEDSIFWKESYNIENLKLIDYYWNCEKNTPFGKINARYRLAGTFTNGDTVEISILDNMLNEEILNFKLQTPTNFNTNFSDGLEPFLEETADKILQRLKVYLVQKQLKETSPYFREELDGLYSWKLIEGLRKFNKARINQKKFPGSDAGVIYKQTLEKLDFLPKESKQ